MPSSSQPITLTISSVASSDISFEDAAVIAGANADATDTLDLATPASPALTEHPTLFIREDMVKIQVEDMLFRLPSFYLLESLYFSRQLSGGPGEQRIKITDLDVTAAGFANLIYVLRPHPGSIAVSTLAQWTEVLHLSSKWEFVHARAAATQAIPPLASPVDKIVLGRTYDLPQWLPDAFADVLGREQAINIQEARRMTLEDLVTIANGRVAARADAVKPRAEIEEIARSGLGLTPGQLTKVDNADLAKALDVTPSVTGEQIAENAQTERQFQEEQIVRWIAQTNTTPGSKTAWNCLHSYTSRHTWSRPYIMAQVLKEGLGVFTSDVVAGCLNRPSAYCKSSLRLDPIMASVVRIMAWPGTNGYSASPQAVQQAHHEAVDYWKGFEDLPYSLGPTNVLKGQPFTALIISTNFMDYMVTHRSLVNSEIYSAFWDALRTIFQKPSLAVHVACVATVVTEALNQLSYCVAKLNVGVEQDTFYHIVDRAATSARQQGRVDDLKALELLVQSREWPMD